MNFNHNHGGNPHGVSDCVARALAIYMRRPYTEVSAALAPWTQQGGVNVMSAEFIRYMLAHGFHYVIGFNDFARTVSNLPANCIAHTSNHYTAIVDGCVQDVIDTRNETVKGYWVSGRLFNVVNALGEHKNSAPLNIAQAIAMRRLLNLNYSLKTEIECYM